MLSSLSTSKSNVLLCLGSIACIVHCFATPFIVMMLPFLGSSLENHFIELGLFVTSILSGTFIMYKGYAAHHKSPSILLYGAGIALWLLHLYLEHEGIPGAKRYFSIGTAFVLGSYFINYRYIKRCPSECCNR